MSHVTDTTHVQHVTLPRGACTCEGWCYFLLPTKIVTFSHTCDTRTSHTHVTHARDTHRKCSALRLAEGMAAREEKLRIAANARPNAVCNLREGYHVVASLGETTWPRPCNAPRCNACRTACWQWISRDVDWTRARLATCSPRFTT